MSWVDALARTDIVALKPYQHAAWEPELIRLHANELPWRALGDESEPGLNRYPQPQPRALVERLAALYDVPSECLLVGRGSDEGIDLLIRAFCRAGEDAVLVCPPTFGMYAVSAAIQGARVVNVPLRPESGFALDEHGVLGRWTPDVKLVFLCSPNNPTGNLLAPDGILRIAATLEGQALVVVDEAYVEFAARESLTRHLSRHPNLCILRTLSKAHGLAGARCGTLIAHPEVIALLRKIISPYAISQLTVDAVLTLLQPVHVGTMHERSRLIRIERERLALALARLHGVRRVWPSKANFLLVEFADAARALLQACADRLLVRDARGYPGLPDALRISVGTPEQNDLLVKAWS